jgi:hypothetical protein
MKLFSSIALFKDIIVEELPDYAVVSDAQILADCKWFLDIGVSKNQASTQVIDYVNRIESEKYEVSEYLLCEIAQLYLETKKEDEIINLLLNAKNSKFKKIIDEVKQISGGIHFIENAAKKSILQELETKLEAEDLEIVLQRIERKEQKERLKELEEQFERENVYASFDYNLTGTEDHNLNYALDPEIKHYRERKMQIKSFIRIAAILILFAIPSSIMLFMVGNDNSGVLKSTKKNKTESSQEFYASNMVEIELPSPNKRILSVKVNTSILTRSVFSRRENPDLLIDVNCINLISQTSYITKKKKELLSYRSKLDSKIFKHKKTTIDSLNNAMFNIEKIKSELISKANTYSFDESTLTLYFNNEKDLQKMKVFNYNESENGTYYLYLDNAFYELKKGKGKLQILTDIDRIEKLEELRMNTP